MFKEFKEFALRGNVIDMAVGVIVGGAFGTIVKSMVDDVIMPPIGLLVGGIDHQRLAGAGQQLLGVAHQPLVERVGQRHQGGQRSEERRVGKEC